MTRTDCRVCDAARALEGVEFDVPLEFWGCELFAELDAPVLPEALFPLLLEPLFQLLLELAFDELPLLGLSGFADSLDPEPLLPFAGVFEFPLSPPLPLPPLFPEFPLSPLFPALSGFLSEVVTESDAGAEFELLLPFEFALEFAFEFEEGFVGLRSAGADAEVTAEPTVGTIAPKLIKISAAKAPAENMRRVVRESKFMETLPGGNSILSEGKPE